MLRLHTDNVIPSVSDIPIMMRNIKNARRGRSVSIGPQSAADAYETLAYRERRRRESVDSQASLRSKGSFLDLRDPADSGPDAIGSGRSSHDVPSGDREGSVSLVSGVHKSSLMQFEEMMGQGSVIESPALKPSGDGILDSSEPDLFVGRQDELGEREMFEKLVKPRVRYDVEVVTKLIVYTGKPLFIVSVPLFFSGHGLTWTGIGWLAVEVIPVMFDILGLGPVHVLV